MRVAYFGPVGTHTHVATRSAFPDTEELALPTIPAVIEAVAAGDVDCGVVPIENSTEGGVSSTQDSLLQNDVKLRGELVLEIAQCLCTREKELADIKRVYSHPQALAQCRTWLATYLPRAELVQAASTASAARQVAGEPGTAAIASALAAEINGLSVLAQVQDRDENATRFVIVAREDAPPTGRDKTSLVFSTAHERGALRRALEAFDAENINLTRIESRPSASLSRTQPQTRPPPPASSGGPPARSPEARKWEYVFFTDIEGHRSDAPVKRALEKLALTCSTVRVLGSYPRAG